jgi:hypothetical protein
VPAIYRATVANSRSALAGRAVIRASTCPIRPPPLGRWETAVAAIASVTSMIRVWLTGWEWACCGPEFAMGDDVDLGIATPRRDSSLAELLGPSSVATVDAVESHHEERFADRVRGRAVGVYAVTHEVRERRSLRRPGYGAPTDAAMPADGGEWPVVRRDLGGGFLADSRPSRYVTEIAPLPDTLLLEPAHGVRIPSARKKARSASAGVSDTDLPADRRVRSLAGWLVDVEDA